MSQPSLSAQIQNLETALHVQLVERGRSGVALTPIGREVADRAIIITRDLQGIVDIATSSKDNLAGTIRLGTSQTLGPYLMPHVVSSLHKRYPELSLYVRERAPIDLEEELFAGEHDVLISQLPSVRADHVVRPLFREPLYLALAVDHPLASKEAVSIRDLKGLNILSLGQQYYLYDQVLRLCETFGARLLRDYEGTSLDALRQMAGMGMGAAFLPALYTHSEIRAQSDVVIRKIEGRSITRSVGLVWRKSAVRVEAFGLIADLVQEIAQKTFDDLIIE